MSPNNTIGQGTLWMAFAVPLSLTGSPALGRVNLALASARRPIRRPRHPDPPIRGRHQPTTLDVLRALARALNVSADSLPFDDNERGPQSPSRRLKLEAVDQFTPDEQEHVAAILESALLRHHARQACSGQAS